MKYVIILQTLLSVNFLFAQSGPGGIGSSDGTSNLVLWHDAAQLTFTDAGVSPTADGDSILQWNDLSGYENHSSQITSDRRPSWNESIINGLPAVYFGDDFMRSAIDINPATTDFSFFVAFQESGSFDRTLISQTGGSGVGRSLFFVNNSVIRSLVGGTNQNSLPWNYSPGVWTVAGNNYDSYDPSLSTPSSSQTFYLNGNTSNTKSGFNGESATGNWIIGAANSGTQRFLFGYIAEMVIFNSLLNKAQLIIIQNYLASKYGLPLLSNDVYIQDDVANGDYDYEVAGIGRVDASNIHNDAKGSGMIRILNPTDLEDDEFLIWGHDNGTPRAIETSDVPPGVEARLERVWRASEVNTSGAAIDVGAVDISFDLTEIAVVTASDLKLLVDTNNNGLFNDETPISGAISLGDNIYAFTGSSAITNNLRFTLGTSNKSETPLPIDILYFRAQNINGQHIQLEWETISESNNDFFTIEKSRNGSDWRLVGRVDGAGNSKTNLKYSLIDNNPYSGMSFYRLKQTDFDGQVFYSDIQSVYLNESLVQEIQLYPNPAESHITIKGNEDELSKMEIYNSIGQDVTDLSSINADHVSAIVLDISALSNGLYYVKTKTITSLIYKK
ncbi:T9SS type A sorting domain-containing protein [Fulvivirga sediminis]|uniref:T9SS type A sorting domain-containing protein n=1 Tax=Fulvivirga sediminis TaxID=2803949 RepID=A0A937FB23_9BACT|nr:T9SS type A sorting domain-containing protein [Fulvivirga sediminis]MBL3658955.1 T9SS type A sorting domain-containing protein [Fulvivirga sediminis]